ncbi:unnamed protein product [Camellia sinensis]
MATTDDELRQVDPTVWKAFAGPFVHIPTLNSRVFYFPQGHAEHSSSPPFLSPLVTSQPLILCRVAAVTLLANPETDEFFAKLRLLPIDRSRDYGGGGVEEDCGEAAAAASFSKILTPSDANNGGGFSVPRFCADSIFPPLNFEAEPPVQTVSIRDVHGVSWEFRHTYRGTPRRHLLTTGWSKFVNHKKLIAGDSVVFVRNRFSGELFVGFAELCGPMPIAVGGGGGKEGFWRSGRGRVSEESVAEAAELAAQGMGFEVVYYPRVGLGDFVVKAESVEESLKVFWTSGMRVKMAMETDDSSRMAWFQGTVSLSMALAPDNCPWRGSPWRMLQKNMLSLTLIVTWDEPEVLQHVKRVSPWQIEYVEPTPPLHSAFPPAKKFRFPQNPGLPTDGKGDLFFPMPGLSNSMIGLSNLISENTHQMCKDKFFGNNVTPKVRTVSTELNIGSSQDNLSPDSPSSVHFYGNELARKQGRNSSTKAGLGSFQLFGKIIHMKDPVESGCDDVGCAEDNGSKMFKETEGVKNLPDLSLTCPYTQNYLMCLMLNTTELQLLKLVLYKLVPKAGRKLARNLTLAVVTCLRLGLYKQEVRDSTST